MRALALLAVLPMLGADLAAAGPYKAELPGVNCRPTLDDWLRLEASRGDKILEYHGGVGAVQEYTVRWDDGAVQRVTVAPAVVDGEAKVCVVARQSLPAVASDASGPAIIPSAARREQR